jgi:hypothetical protein
MLFTSTAIGHKKRHVIGDEDSDVSNISTAEHARYFSIAPQSSNQKNDKAGQQQLFFGAHYVLLWRVNVVQKINFSTGVSNSFARRCGVESKTTLQKEIPMSPLLPILSAFFAHSPLQPVPIRDTSIDRTIEKVESMVSDHNARRMVQGQGLSLVNVTWEDTGRSKGSAWGPNISDMTIGVRDSRGLLHPMPVMRFDNFNDVTADISSDKFSLLVGNQNGGDLQAVKLKEVLQDTRDFLHNRRSWRGVASSLWSARDAHVLVSAQGAFLPVSQSGTATFTPVLYNYQSSPGAPAVATIVATSQGTSIQVVENNSGYMSEELFFNDDGERAPFTATRLSSFNRQQASQGLAQATEEDGLDVVLVIQVPLKVERLSRGLGSSGFGVGGGGFGALEEELGAVTQSAPSGDMAKMGKKIEKSDVETAVIGTGETEGPFKEINNLSIERDHDYPIRVTVQFYKATSNGVVTAADVAKVRRQIERVYSEGDWVGSLVTAGFTDRPTESVPNHGSGPRWATQPHWGWLRSY